MKYIIAFLLTLLITAQVFAQTIKIPPSGGGGGGGDATQLQGIDITTTDPLRGQFLYYDLENTELRYKYPNYVDARDFGAVCDGTNNDTTAVQDALNAAASTGGGSILLKGACRTSGTLTIANGTRILIQGTWVLNSTLTIGNQVDIIGLGGCTPVQFQSGQVACILPSATFSAGTTLVKMTGNGIIKRMNDIAIQGVTGIGLLLQDGSSFYAENIGVINDSTSTVPAVVFDRFYIFDIRRSVFAATNSSADWSVQFTNTDIAPNILQTGLGEFHHLTLAGYGMLAGATHSGLVAGISFDGLLYESGNNALLTLDATAGGIGAFTFKNVEIADAIAVPSEINILNQTNTIQNFIYDNPTMDSILQSGAPFITGGYIQGLYYRGANNSPTGGINLGTQDVAQATLINKDEFVGSSYINGQEFNGSAIPIAPLAISQDPTVWASGSGTATITGGQTDPRGKTNAGRCSTSNPTDFRRVTATSVSASVGDYIIGGVWAKPVTNDVYFPSHGTEIPFGFTATVLLNGAAAIYPNADTFRIKNSSWTFVPLYGVVTTGGTSDFYIDLKCATGNSVDYYAPWAMKVPAASGSREALRLMRVLRNVPNGASAGEITLFPDDVLRHGNVRPDGLRIPNSTSLPATCAVGDSFMDTDATTGQRWYLCESTNTWVKQGDGGGGTVAVTRPFKMSAVSATDANAMPFTVNGTNFDYSVIRFVDAVTGTAYYTFEIPQNLASTPAWNIQLKHKAISGSGGNVSLFIECLDVATGSTFDAALTDIFGTSGNPDEKAVNTSAQLTSTNISATNLDGTEAITAGSTLVCAIQRQGGDANDTINADWMLISVNFLGAENS